MANYSYLWNGEKVSVEDEQANGYLYLGSVRYALTHGDATFESVPFSMGRITKSNNGYAVHLENNEQKKKR